MTDRFFMITLVFGLLGTMLTPGFMSAQEMTSEMGPPEELKAIHPMNGEFDVELEYKIDPSASDWSKTEGRARVEMLLDGAAQQMTWGFDMMGMKVEVVDVLTYDREAGVWRRSSIDNLSARMTISEGKLADDELVLSGRDMMQGMELNTRQTISRISDKGFEWRFEMSLDGGENYMTQMTASFKKR